jgi:hypothetical protein
MNKKLFFIIFGIVVFFDDFFNWGSRKLERIIARGDYEFSSILIDTFNSSFISTGQDSGYLFQVNTDVCSSFDISFAALIINFLSPDISSIFLSGKARISL